MTLKWKEHTGKTEMMMAGGSHVESMSFVPRNITAGNTHTYTTGHMHKPHYSTSF